MCVDLAKSMHTQKQCAPEKLFEWMFCVEQILETQNWWFQDDLWIWNWIECISTYILQVSNVRLHRWNGTFLMAWHGQNQAQKLPNICFASHSETFSMRSHQNELQMFAIFVSVKLENVFRLSFIATTTTTANTAKTIWLTVNSKVSLLCVVCHVEWSLIIGFRYNCDLHSGGFKVSNGRCAANTLYVYAWCMQQRSN